MKTILVVFSLCLVSALALTEDQKTKLSQFKKDCIAETGVDSKVVDDAKAGNYNESDEKLDCFSSCMLKKVGIMNQDGSINEETARQKAPAGVTKEQLDEVFNKCRDTTGPNDCKKAANLVKCFKENKTFSVFN